MEEVIEKIYCCDRGDNDNALAAAILAGNNRRDGWGPMAAMMGGGMNNWMNNPFAYLMFMALLRNGQRDIGFAITQGFSATAFQAQQDKCDILRAGQNNTQRIIDTLNNHWKLTKLLHYSQSLVLCIRKSKKQSSASARLRSPSVAWKNS